MKSMNKEEALELYKEKYKSFLYDNGSKEDAEEARDFLFNNGFSADLKRVQDSLMSEYYKEVVNPLSTELLDLLQFEGMKKGDKYQKKAQELREELSKKDKMFLVRKCALEDFFVSKTGSKYDEERKLELALRLGALDI